MLHKKFIKKITIKQRRFFMFSLNFFLPLEENLFPFSLFHTFFVVFAYENEQIPTIPSMQSESEGMEKAASQYLYFNYLLLFVMVLWDVVERSETEKVCSVLECWAFFRQRRTLERIAFFPNKQKGRDEIIVKTT